ncbi:MAG: hypothetical protein Q8J80_02650 [Gallionella sp.]|nr:hypothetical protein [Gallionella sp.]
MGIKEELRELIEELNRVHTGGLFDGGAWHVADELPDFVTAQNGYQRHFTKKARTALRSIAETVHENDINISSRIEIGNFEKIVKQCVADLHAEGELDIVNLNKPVEAVRKLKDRIEDSLSQMQMEFTHYFPAWTLGMETEHPFELGPVTFMTREQWIDSVDFSQNAINQYLSFPENNARWKDSLKQALRNPADDEDIAGLAEPIYSAIRDCSSVLKITVKGYEINLSRKVGEIVCKSALDSISLLFEGREFFHQQALCNERLQPVRSSSIIETNGYLWLPGSSVGPRIPRLSYPQVHAFLADKSDILEVIGRILNALVDPATSKYPNLSKRWATALDWMAEGRREKNDAVALTKIASSLDVLACGGKFPGILGMLKNFTNCSEDTIVVTGSAPRTLRQVIQDIYDSGRSQILHGTHFDRLKSFEVWNGYAAYFARLALIECAVRLNKFTGVDGDKEFRTMPD